MNGDRSEPPPVVPSNLIDQKKIGVLMGACKEHGVSEDALKAYLKDRYKLDSRKQITLDAYESIMEWIKGGGVD